jgi:hypothetical protein
VDDYRWIVDLISLPFFCHTKSKKSLKGIKPAFFIKRKGLPYLANPLLFHGAGGENRTHKGLRPADFESAAFTNFTTPA